MSAPNEVQKYLSAQSSEAQEILNKIRELVLEEAPKAVELISYGIITYKLDGKNLVHFGAYAKHIGLYPAPEAITTFDEQLKPYKKSKGTVQLPLNKPIPYDLVRQIVRYRVRSVAK